MRSVKCFEVSFPTVIRSIAGQSGSFTERMENKNFDKIKN